ncbi:MAG: hypothetical protein M1818_003014 [Claussenomyces sp. TS43310]|nr:MAG: hypothetical protein M1818_003014 [Claussenomyces sp. TS43310]
MAVHTQPAASQENHEPNPTYGKLPWSDVPRLLTTLLSLPVAASSSLVRHFISHSPRSWTEDLTRAIFRHVTRYIPFAVLRRPVSMKPILSSTRFSAVAAGLNEHIVTPKFAGYWLCKPGYSATAPPSTSDVVILYMHGGGFVIGHPEQYATFLLAMIETITCERPGAKVSLFNLDYALAPESRFPTQIGNAAAAYEYLTLTMGIPPQKIVLMGDSAGGSLALGLLSHLKMPIDTLGVPGERSVPGGVYLICPWLTFEDSNASFRVNSGSDILTTKGLQKWSSLLFASDVAEREYKMYADFVNVPREKGSWRETLPAKVWITAGADELFVGDIANFAELLKTDGVDVELHVEEGQAHVWPVNQALLAASGFLKQARGTPVESGMSGALIIGKAVARQML